jgi:hypothetical protein
LVERDRQRALAGEQPAVGDRALGELRPLADATVEPPGAAQLREDGQLGGSLAGHLGELLQRFDRGGCKRGLKQPNRRLVGSKPKRRLTVDRARVELPTQQIDGALQVPAIDARSRGGLDIGHALRRIRGVLRRLLQMPARLLQRPAPEGLGLTKPGEHVGEGVLGGRLGERTAQIAVCEIGHPLLEGGRGGGPQDLNDHLVVRGLGGEQMGGDGGGLLPLGEHRPGGAGVELRAGGRTQRTVDRPTDERVDES